MNLRNANIFTISTFIIFFVISNIDGAADDEVAETSSALKLETRSSSTVSNEYKNLRGPWNSNFEIGESSKPNEIENLNENAIKEEKRDISKDYSSDVTKFQCKWEAEEDDVNDDDVGEIEKLEKRDISLDYLTDVVKFECKFEEEEDDVNDDVGVDDVNDNVGVDDVGVDDVSDNVGVDDVNDDVGADDANDDDVCEIEKSSKSNVYEYAFVDSNNKLILYEIRMYCEECDEPFDTIKNFEKHATRFHRGKKIFACEYENCGIGFTKLCNLYAHHHRYHGLRFQKLRLNKTRVGKKDVVCHKCGDTFQRATEFERHYANVHKNEGKLGLNEKEQCDEYEAEMDDSEGEIIGENEENEFSKNKIFAYTAVGPDRNIITYKFETHCRECDEPFYTINSYESHYIRSHSNKRIFACEIGNCKRSFSRLWNLLHHHYQNHGLRFRKKSFPKAIFDEILGGFPTYCEECRLECNTTHSLETHARDCHPSRKIFACMVTDCRSVYRTASNLMNHLNVKHGRQKKKKLRKAAAKSGCPLCGRPFGKVKDIYAHAREAHPREKLWKCSLCPASFTKISNRNRHEKITHAGTGRSPGYCKYCNKSFITLNYVPIHEMDCKERKQRQTEYMPPSTPGDVYECQECGKIFHKNRWKYFVQHEDRHKRYARCPVCNWRIDVSGGSEVLKSHVKVHHPRKYEEVDFEKLLI